MTDVDSLAAEIIRHHQQGASLYAIGFAIKRANVHIDTAVVAFEKAGFSAEHKVQTILRVRIVTLNIVDRRQIKWMEDQLQKIRQNAQSKDLETLSLQLNNLVSELSLLPKGEAVVIDWTNGHF